MNSTPAPETVIERAIRGVLARSVRVALPGIVETYDSTRCEASVQIAIMEPFRNELGTRSAYPLAVVPHVPVYFPGGGGMRDTWPVKRGDSCLLVFCSSSIGEWLVQGGVIDADNDQQHHHLSDAVAYVGLADFAHVRPAHANARVMETDDLRIGDVDANDPLVRKSDLDSVVARLNTAIDALIAHVHTSSAPGNPTSGPLGGAPPAPLTLVTVPHAASGGSAIAKVSG